MQGHDVSSIIELEAKPGAPVRNQAFGVAFDRRRVLIEIEALKLGLVFRDIADDFNSAQAVRTGREEADCVRPDDWEEAVGNWPPVVGGALVAMEPVAGLGNGKGAIGTVAIGAEDAADIAHTLSQ